MRKILQHPGITKHKDAIGYGIIMAAMFLLMQWLEYNFLILQYRIGMYIGIIAVIFTLIGIWLSRKLSDPKIETIVVRPSPEIFSPKPETLETLGISKREFEVLELMAAGLSNNEIAETLFVSTNTVKSHVARLFEKLDVKRRTQAVEKAKSLQLLA